MSWHDVSLRSFDVQYLDSLQQSMTEEEPCPIFTAHKQPPNENIVYIKDDDKKIYSRKPLIPMLKYYPTYLIWSYDIKKVLI